MSAHKTTSPAGIEFLERHEGVVLRAYRDPVGILTIGAGLTKASGVIDPKPGMVLSKKEASRLLALALGRNYEPRVRNAMPGCEQHEFDGGVSFDFNTGAIHRASWVMAWAKGDKADMRRRLGLWNKASGRVLPGLTRRRAEEANLIEHASYGDARTPAPRNSMHARIALQGVSVSTIRDGLDALGYDVGADVSEVRIGAVRSFQRDHDLTVDGIIGRATLATLQRRLDAKRKVNITSGTSAAGTAVGAGVSVSDMPVLDAVSDLAPFVPLAIGAMFFAYLAYRYRDVLAAKLQIRLPKIAAWLRSF
ncbi:MAG: peptidoglycan-binding protein [Pseudomonadota bacterium]